MYHEVIVLRRTKFFSNNLCRYNRRVDENAMDNIGFSYKIALLQGCYNACRDYWLYISDWLFFKVII